MRSRIAEVAITMSKKARTELNRFAALEAMGRISQHGIDELGLRKSLQELASQHFRYLYDLTEEKDV